MNSRSGREDCMKGRGAGLALNIYEDLCSTSGPRGETAKDISVGGIKIREAPCSSRPANIVLFHATSSMQLRLDSVQKAVAVSFKACKKARQARRSDRRTSLTHRAGTNRITAPFWVCAAVFTSLLFPRVFGWLFPKT